MFFGILTPYIEKFPAERSRRWWLWRWCSHSWISSMQTLMCTKRTKEYCKWAFTIKSTTRFQMWQRRWRQRWRWRAKKGVYVCNRRIFMCVVNFIRFWNFISSFLLSFCHNHESFTFKRFQKCALTLSLPFSFTHIPLIDAIYSVIFIYCCIIQVASDNWQQDEKNGMPVFYYLYFSPLDRCCGAWAFGAFWWLFRVLLLSHMRLEHGKSIARQWLCCEKREANISYTAWSLTITQTMNMHFDCSTTFTASK